MASLRLYVGIPDGDWYATVTPAFRLTVSRHIRADFENRRDDYALHGMELALPRDRLLWPREEFLRWHNEERWSG